MQLKYKETLGRGRGEEGAGVLTSGACDEGGAGRRRGQGRGSGARRMAANVEVGVGGGVRGGVEVGGGGGVEVGGWGNVESGVGGGIEGVRRAHGGRWATAAARVESWICGKWP